MADPISGAQAKRIRFGPFEADAAAGELRKDGRLIRLQELPFQLLLSLLDRPGEVVTRDELRQRLWPDDSFGDFDQGLNTAINKLREALGDSAAGPKFVETVPKRGYRFIHALESEPPPAQPPPSRPKVSWRWIAGAAAILVVVLIASFAFRPADPPVRLPLRRFLIDPAVPVASRVFFDPVHAVSPNGRFIAYTTDESPSRIAVHDLEQGAAEVLPGTEGARMPFWSPDSELLGFPLGGDLKKIRLQNRSAGLLCQACARFFMGASWHPDGQSIVFAEGTPANLFEVPASGGTRRLVLTAAQLRYRESGRDPKELGYLSSPQFLPLESGRRVVLFSAGKPSATLMVKDLDGGREEVLWPGVLWVGGGAYSKTGHILYRPPLGSAEIWARPFSVRTLKATGEAFQVLRDAAEVSTADDGALVHVDALSASLAWLNRKGERIASVGQPLEGFFYPALSPDGLRVAVEAFENTNLDLWVYDLQRGARTRLTTHPATDILPVWSPDSQRLAFSSYRPGNIDVFLSPADGSAGEQAIVSGPDNERVSDWSSDGRRILYSRITADHGFDLWYAESGGGGWKHTPFLQTRANEHAAKLSPDGRFVAYVSDETGRNEIFVRPFPAGEGKWPISTHGGRQIRWRRDGRELFFTQDAALFGVTVQTAPGFRPGVPVPLFTNQSFQVPGVEANYDVAPDGQRFLVPERLGGTRKLHFVQNWVAAFGK